MVRIPTDREPTHPGEMLLQEFLLATRHDPTRPRHRDACALSARQ